METKIHRDFASYLDDVRAIEPEADIEDAPAAPTITFDYLAVADELHSGRIHVEPDRRKNAEPETGGFYRAELEAYLDAAAPFVASPPLSDEILPSIEPADIAVELGLDRADRADFTRIRRSFAFANHPDRVAPHLRDRAMRRMQIANMLLDEARSRARLPAKS
jgi:hypothetical protein